MCKKDALIAELDRSLNLLIQKVTRDLLAMIRGKLSPSQFAILRFIRECGRSTVSQVAEELQVTLSGVTSLADRMVDAGLIERTRDDADRRVVWIDLTEKGRQLSAELERIRRSMVERYTRRLTEQEIEGLNAVLGKILDDNPEVGA